MIHTKNKSGETTKISYNPRLLTEGVKLGKCIDAPYLGKDKQLCRFEPHLAPNIIPSLARIMGYEESSSVRMTKGDTEIDFDGTLVTAIYPEDREKRIIDDLNEALRRFFEERRIV